MGEGMLAWMRHVAGEGDTWDVAFADADDRPTTGVLREALRHAP